ncbi:IPTL-CTERM sorting domain-containing protein [uncultured Thiothrix sp.]|uniref:IPTL-CTERM sorting domain-containing protein n=1 Tax=uncultured Thiothrix sp. TaxID=223185 RepID=UPI002609C2A2|nr:IPTL-CTERM sorting domain-containing protein [uncultured Thiothrix sp.]HMT93853.1 IPTL-CTERM sorting domain-containing protein [Thiolinea sp.]
MMKKSLKQAVLRGIAFVLATQAGYALAAPTEGVEFSIRWDATSSLYRVYMRPVSTPAAPDITMSAQVTIRVPHAELPNQFTIPTSSITAAHSEWAWPITSKADAPPESPSFDYFSFTASVPNSAAREVGWQAGVEQEVFSFKNTGKCLGAIALINNDTDPIIGGVSNLNAGNEFSHRSWDAANDYIGNYGAVTAADCTASASTNSAPKAITDNASVVSGGSVTVDALANDTDANNDALVLQHATDGDFGKAVIKNGKLVYTADAAYVGADTFSYFVSDAKGGVTEGTVNVTVNSATTGTDTDGDGLTDTQEQSLGTNPAAADTDLDGVPDKVEVGADVTTPVDTDGDGKINALDADDDGDGIPTKGEDQNLDADKNPSTQPTDTDGDGKPNYLDADDDGDGKLTKSEDDNTDGDGNPQTNPRDTDGDGIPDPIDSNDASSSGADDDGDGLTNAEEVKLGTNPNQVDTDGDSVPDAKEVGSDLAKPLDTDGDGIINALDQDDDNDGVFSIYEHYKGADVLNTDTDADGTPDYLDADDDGDGVATNKETADANKDGNPADAADVDKNGLPDYLDKSFVNTLTPTKVSVPTLSQWAQILLTMLLGLLAVRRFAKRD